MCLRWIVIGLLLTVTVASAAAEVPDWVARHPENVWIKQSPRPGQPSPALNYEGGAVYDPFVKKLIHHAGHWGIPQTERTFAFDLETGRWEQRFPPTAPPGACCVDSSFAFDVAQRRLVRFPGGSLGHGYQFSRSVYLKSTPSPVWVYDAARNEWTGMRPPPYQQAKGNSSASLGGLNPGTTYDPVHEVILHRPVESTDLVVYDGYTNALDRFPAGKDGPGRRGHPGMAYDPGRNRLILFGSNYQEDPRTWLFDYGSKSWQGLDLTPHPPVKKVDGTHSSHPSLAYDSRNNVMLCVTTDVKAASHGTWILELTPELRWREMTPAVSPDRAGTRRRNLAYSHEHNLFILELAPVKGESNEVWTYRYRNPLPEKKPEPPTDLAALSDAAKVTLQWQASPTASVTSYRVYRAQADKPWQTEYAAVAKVKGTTFTDADVKPGTIYFYKVSALAGDGGESARSQSARTQPRVLIKPVVSVLAKDKLEITWNPHPAPDILGYNVYRGLVTVATVKKGIAQPWRDNDPEYPEPLVKGVSDITAIVRLNDAPLADARFLDAKVDLAARGPESGDYKYAVYAYIVRAVNKLGFESGPSPYALTIPSEPANVLLRNGGKDTWELKWDPNPEKGIAGYRVYKTTGVHTHLLATPDILKEPRLLGNGGFALWVTAVDILGQEGAPSSPARVHNNYRGFYEGEWHQ